MRYYFTVRGRMHDAARRTREGPHARRCRLPRRDSPEPARKTLREPLNIQTPRSGQP